MKSRMLEIWNHPAWLRPVVDYLEPQLGKLSRPGRRDLQNLCYWS